MEKKKMHLIAGSAMFVLCFSICTTTTNATVVWSDDFDDGNFDGWTICDVAELASVLPGFNGSTWNATNNYLELIQSPDPWGSISHPSSAAYGNWSFDFKDNDILSRSGDTALVVFISNNLYDWDDFFQDANYYWIDFDVVTTENYTITLKKRSGSVLTTIDTAEVPAAGWHHFDVTRNTIGWFSVYHNDTLIIQGEDTEFDTSELFWLWFEEGLMVDNIVVDEVIPTTTPTPTTTSTPPPLPWELIVIGGGVAVVVIVLAIVILRRR